jgi:glycosyltransferase involved in cell wall biosynthesis
MGRLVSILIPCFNAERRIGQAIESALGQTYSPTEVIVVDDGSTDRSLDIIKGFGQCIRWETGPNRGANAARNRLLSLASGSWLQYLDADDYLLPDKVERQMELLAKHPEVDVVYSPISMVFERPTEAGHRFVVIPIPEPCDPWLLFVRGDLPQTGGPLWRKAALEAVGGWKNERTCYTCEYQLYLRLLIADSRFLYCPHVGAVYRQWSDDTLCRRDIPELTRQRAELIDSAEEWLASQGELTYARKTAIDQARLKIARQRGMLEARDYALNQTFPN